MLKFWHGGKKKESIPADDRKPFFLARQQVGRVGKLTFCPLFSVMADSLPLNRHRPRLALRLWRAIIAALWTQVSAHSVCFGLERPVAASVFDVVGAYVTVP